MRDDGRFYGWFCPECGGDMIVIFEGRAEVGEECDRCGWESEATKKYKEWKNKKEGVK